MATQRNLGTLTTGTFPAGLKPVVSGTYDSSSKQLQPLYTQFMNSMDMQDKYNQYTAYAGLSTAQVKLEGSPTIYDGAEQLWTTTLTSTGYSTGFIVTHEEQVDDHLFKMAAKAGQEMAKSMHRCKEIAAHAVLNRAFDTNYLGGDGKPLCSTTHPTLAADFNNSLDAAFSLSSLQQALINMMSWKDNRGGLINVKATRLVLPPALMFDYHKLVRTSEQYGTADRNSNPLKMTGMLQADPVVTPYLTSSAAFFILTDMNDENGLIHLTREAAKIDQDLNFDVMATKFRIFERWVDGFLDPRCVYGSDGS